VHQLRYPYEPSLNILTRHAYQVRTTTANERAVRFDRHVLRLSSIEHDARTVATRHHANDAVAGPIRSREPSHLPYA